MSILDNAFEGLEGFKLYLVANGFKLGRDEWTELIWEAKMIGGVPTLVCKGNPSVISRPSAHINLNKWAVRRLYQDGYKIKIDYDPKYLWGNVNIAIYMDAFKPEDFKALLEDVSVANLTLNMDGVFSCNLKEYFTKKMDVKMISINNMDGHTGKPSSYTWCNLVIPAGFWKICPKLAIKDMKSIKIGGSIDGYELLHIDRVPNH